MALARRTLLKAVSMGLLAGTAGCLSDYTSTGPRDQTFDTPIPGECSAITPPNPTPTEENLQPLPYPEYPDSLTADTANEFAEEFEKAFRHNEFMAADNFIKATDDVLFTIGVKVYEQREHGFIIGVDGTLHTEDTRTPPGRTPRPGTKTHTVSPLLDEEFGAWYYLTDRFALRKPLDDDFPIGTRISPDLTNAEPIYCR